MPRTRSSDDVDVIHHSFVQLIENQAPIVIYIAANIESPKPKSRRRCCRQAAMNEKHREADWMTIELTVKEIGLRALFAQADDLDLSVRRRFSVQYVYVLFYDDGRIFECGFDPKSETLWHRQY